MKKLILILFSVVLCTNFALSQELSFDKNYMEPLADNYLIAELESDEEVAELEVQKEKSISKGILMSLAVPGAGQIYAGKKYGFIYTAIEIAAWAGYFIYQKKGDDKIDEYEKFADAHYDTTRFYQVKRDLVAQAIEHAEQVEKLNVYVDLVAGPDEDQDGLPDYYEIVEGKHFSLDDTKTQHYYEDIGKYDKYIFGWDDWFSKAYYSTVEGQPGIEDYYEYDPFIWNEWNPNEDPVIPDEIGEDQNGGVYRYYYGNQTSENREKYRSMRKDANDYHGKADTALGIMLANHFISAIDAGRTVSNYNKQIAQKEKPVKLDFAVDWARKDPQAKLALVWNY